MIQTMAAAKSEFETDLKIFKSLSMAAVQMMLAGGELWDTDFEETLKEKTDFFDQDFAEPGIVTDSAVTPDMEPGIEAVGNIEDDKPLELDEAKKFHYAEIAYTVEAIEQILNGFLPVKQKQVLQVVMGRQPERDALAEKENRRQEATDKLHETLDTWPTEEIEILSGVVEKAESAKQLQLV